MVSIAERAKSAWNAFKNEEQPENGEGNTDPNSRLFNFGTAYGGMRSDRRRSSITNERSIIVSIYTRVAIDVAAIQLRHIRRDSNGRYQSDVASGLNYCLTEEANLDQGASAFRQDIVATLLEKGTSAVVPVDTTMDPTITGGFDIKTMRVGEIVQWYPRHVKVSAYDDRDGNRKELMLPKAMVAIVENPLYAIMNEPNSTLQRLIRKLSLLDAVDEQSSSGKLDIVIQLPYVIKSEQRRQQAEQRRTDIEMQLKGSQYGIAYIDGTEKVTQLNRPAENNLLAQIEYLTDMLYSQLGITKAVMDGTADEAAMLNYNNRTIKPILKAIREALSRSFLSKTARTQGQAIEFFINPFELVPIAQFAEIVDKFTRNEVTSANEMREFIGLKPSSDPKAEELRNSNMPRPDTEPASTVDEPVVTTE
jgi:hypothetical protein